MKAGLRRRMLVLLGLSIFLVLGGLSAYFTLTLRSYSVETYMKISSTEIAGYSEVIQKKTDYAFSLVRAFSSQLEANESIPLDIRRSIIISQMEPLYNNNKKELVDFWVVWEPNAFDGRDAEFVNDKPAHDDTGRFVPVFSQGGLEPVIGYNVPGLDDWYVEPLKNQRDFASEPYDFTYANDNRQVKLLTLSTPIVKKGKSVGVVGTDLDIDGLMKMVGGLYSNGAKAVLLTGEGTFLVPHAKDAEGKNVKDMPPALREVFAKAASGHAAQGEFTDEATGETIFMAYTPITIGNTGKPWVLGVHVPESLVFAEANATTLTAAVAGVFALVFLMILTALIAGTIVRPLQKVGAAADEVARGNLDVELESTGREDEIEALVRALRGMIANLREKILDVEEKNRQAAMESERAHQATSEALAAQKKTEEGRAVLMDTAGKVGEVVRRVGAAIEELSALVAQSGKSANMQAAKLGETAQSMAELYETVESVAVSAQGSAEASAHAGETAQEGAAVVRTSVESIATVQAGIVDLKEKMQALSELTRSIDNIITVISDIADQTNLLALNAAIEAARAGEFGRGFAVVADEVRKLAEKTMGATKEVTSTIIAINKGIDGGLTGVDKAVVDIDASTVQANASGKALDGIVREVEAIDSRIAHIAAAAQQQLAACRLIAANVDNVAGMAGETTTAMKSSSSALEELVQQNAALQGLMRSLLPDSPDAR